MSERELEIIRGAFMHALEVGAPGLSSNMRGIIVANAMRRIRHEFNMPKPTLSPQHRANEHG